MNWNSLSAVVLSRDVLHIYTFIHIPNYTLTLTKICLLSMNHSPPADLKSCVKFGFIVVATDSDGDKFHSRTKVTNIQYSSNHFCSKFPLCGANKSALECSLRLCQKKALLNYLGELFAENDCMM